MDWNVAMISKSLKAVSLFSGAGGCSLGFSDSGFDIIAAYENNDAALATYNTNFLGEKAHKADLSTCNFRNILSDLSLNTGDLDIIIGGPPCQGFTTAGNRFWNDPRNKLVQNYANALEIFYPRWFLMENVEGILTTAQGVYIIETVKKMLDMGYSVYLKKIYMHEFGIPQRRKRVFIIGNREGKEFAFPIPNHRATGRIYCHGNVTLYDAIADLENKIIPEIDHYSQPTIGIKKERMAYLKQGQSMKDLPYELQHSSFLRRSSRRVCDGTPSEKRGGSPSGLKRLVYDEPCLTITSASHGEFIHPNLDRMLTIRECARIQTFPDTFKFIGSESQKMIQIGNAIPPAFARVIADQILECDKGERRRKIASLELFDLTKSEVMSPALARTCKMLQDLRSYQNHQMTLEEIIK